MFYYVVFMWFFTEGHDEQRYIIKNNTNYGIKIILTKIRSFQRGYTSS